MQRYKLAGFLIHIAGWLVFLSFPLLFMNRGQNDSADTYAIILSPYYWLFGITYLIIFYLNGLYLVPKLIFKQKYTAYAIIIALLALCIFYLQPFDHLMENNRRGGPPPRFDSQRPPDFNGPNGNNRPFGPPPADNRDRPGPDFDQPNRDGFHRANHFDMVSMFIFIMMIGVSMGVTSIKKWQLTEQKMAKAEADKTQAELSFLKAQINPHFLFNTLNNIYVLSVTQSEHTSDSIMKLSNIMRYVTDEVSDNLVSLKNEWDCIHDYIDLQKLRLGKKTKLTFELIGQIEQQQIAPLVLMTFIENVFKYGISKHDATEITIRLTLEGNKLLFFCQNTIVEKGIEKKSTGIGINNTRKRLNHIYPGKYNLDINTDDNLFTVNLIINS